MEIMTENIIINELPFYDLYDDQIQDTLLQTKQVDINNISEVLFNPFSEIDTGETFLSVDSDLDPDKTILKELKIKSISVNIMMKKVSRN